MSTSTSTSSKNVKKRPLVFDFSQETLAKRNSVNNKHNYFKNSDLPLAEPIEGDDIHQTTSSSSAFFADNKPEKSALHLAFENNDMDEVKKLVAAGADVNLPDAEGKTPLFWAMMSGSLELVGLLVEKGANLRCPSIVDLYGFIGRKDDVDNYELVEIYELLIYAGLNIHFQGEVKPSIFSQHISSLEYYVTKGERNEDDEETITQHINLLKLFIERSLAMDFQPIINRFEKLEAKQGKFIEEYLSNPTSWSLPDDTYFCRPNSISERIKEVIEILKNYPAQCRMQTKQTENSKNKFTSY